MALRNIVKIDQDKCNGCGLCVNACAEGAIELIDGKAKLIREDYCDGLGACLGHCPQNAISVEKRDAAEFDEAAVKEHLEQRQKPKPVKGFVCPGLISKKLRENNGQPRPEHTKTESRSKLEHWPVQLRLVSPTAGFFADAEVLLVGDCVPFAMGDFHEKLLKGRSIIVGCPKLDDVGFYIDKLAEILKINNLKSLTVVHMEVPCCFGLSRIASQAIEKSGKKLDFEDITVDLQGNVLKTEMIEI